MANGWLICDKFNFCFKLRKFRPTCLEKNFARFLKTNMADETWYSTTFVFIFEPRAFSPFVLLNHRWNIFELFVQLIKLEFFRQYFLNMMLITVLIYFQYTMYLCVTRWTSWGSKSYKVQLAEMPTKRVATI